MYEFWNIAYIDYIFTQISQKRALESSLTLYIYSTKLKIEISIPVWMGRVVKFLKFNFGMFLLWRSARVDQELDYVSPHEIHVWCIII